MHVAANPKAARTYVEPEVRLQLVPEIRSHGELIRLLRKERRITQGELARQSGITQTAVSGIELGKSAGTIDNLEKIASILGERNRILELREGFTMNGIQDVGRKAQVKEIRRESETAPWENELAGTVWRFRLRANMTQMKLSEETGIPQTTLSKMERDMKSTSKKNILLISSVLGLTDKERESLLEFSRQRIEAVSALGARLMELMDMRHMGISELAAESGLPKRTVHQILTKRDAEASHVMLGKIAEAMKLDWNDARALLGFATVMIKASPEVGNIIVNARRIVRLSRNRLADETGISDKVIALMEGGHRPISMAAFKEIDRVLWFTSDERKGILAHAVRE